MGANTCITNEHVGKPRGEIAFGILKMQFSTANLINKSSAALEAAIKNCEAIIITEPFAGIIEFNKKCREKQKKMFAALHLT
jgi:hypothetical protein